MNNLLVSIIIPVFNAEKYLGETINAVLAQTWQNIEIIIVNDGSTDNSKSIINSFTEAEIILIDQTNQGVSAAKQAGLCIAKGAFIQYLDADDLLHPTKIEKQVIALLDNPDKIAICKTTHFFDNIDNNIPDDDHFFREYLNDPLNFLIKLYGGFDLVGGMIQPNAFLTPAGIIKKAGPWNTSISPCTDEDGEYFCRIILHSKGIVYQPETLNFYRKTRSKKSLSGVINEITYSNLVESIWLKHKHLLTYANGDEQIANIHDATYQSLEQVKINIYYDLKKVVAQILAYQKQLTPSRKPGSPNLGGNVITLIAKVAGWKFARWLQHKRGKLSI